MRREGIVTPGHVLNSGPRVLAAITAQNLQTTLEDSSAASLGRMDLQMLNS
jgi:hypothetical protein